jgi:hypothetical protein
MEIVNRMLTDSSWRTGEPLEDLVGVETVCRKITPETKVMMS